MFGFLISLSHTTTLDFVLQLEVFFVNSALLGKDLFNLRVAHLFLVVEVLDARLSDRDVDLDEVGFLTSLHGLSLGLLGEVAIVEFAVLLALGPAKRENVSI